MLRKGIEILMLSFNNFNLSIFLKQRLKIFCVLILDFNSISSHLKWSGSFFNIVISFYKVEFSEQEKRY